MSHDSGVIDEQIVSRQLVSLRDGRDLGWDDLYHEDLHGRELVAQAYVVALGVAGLPRAARAKALARSGSKVDMAPAKDAARRKRWRE